MDIELSIGIEEMYVVTALFLTFWMWIVTKAIMFNMVLKYLRSIDLKELFSRKKKFYDTAKKPENEYKKGCKDEI